MADASLGRAQRVSQVQGSMVTVFPPAWGRGVTLRGDKVTCC